MILMALVPCVKLDALTLEFKPYVVEGKCLAKHQDVCSIVLRILPSEREDGIHQPTAYGPEFLCKILLCDPGPVT